MGSTIKTYVIPLLDFISFLRLIQGCRKKKRQIVISWKDFEKIIVVDNKIKNIYKLCTV